MTQYLILQVHDIFYPFIQTTEDEFTFIWVNESKTGFSHLYKITSVLQPGCFHWTEESQSVEGKKTGLCIYLKSDLSDWYYFISWLICLIYIFFLLMRSFLILLPFSPLRRLQMCNQGRGYIDLWGMGSAGKTWFQGECQIYKKLINHTCLRHRYSKKM